MNICSIVDFYSGLDWNSGIEFDQKVHSNKNKNFSPFEI
jgi:hypothetical protein